MLSKYVYSLFRHTIAILTRYIQYTWDDENFQWLEDPVSGCFVSRRPSFDRGTSRRTSSPRSPTCLQTKEGGEKPMGEKLNIEGC